MFVLFYLNCIPDSPFTDFLANIFLVISKGIVALAPESLPSIVRVVNNVVFVPNNDVLLIAVKVKLLPNIVSLTATDVYGLCVADRRLPPAASKDANNLLSAIVAE